MEWGLFKTFAAAEVYTHFVLINICLSAWLGRHEASAEENTEQLLVGTNAQHRGGRRRRTGTGLGAGC